MSKTLKNNKFQLEKGGKRYVIDCKQHSYRVRVYDDGQLIMDDKNLSDWQVFELYQISVWDERRKNIIRRYDYRLWNALRERGWEYNHAYVPNYASCDSFTKGKSKIAYDIDIDKCEITLLVIDNSSNSVVKKEKLRNARMRICSNAVYLIDNWSKVKICTDTGRVTITTSLVRLDTCKHDILDWRPNEND